MRSPFVLLLSRSRRQRANAVASDDNGLLDILTNVVGVLALVTSLTAIFAAASSLNIQTPMAVQTKQRLYLLQASKDGVWDLQPAVERMTTLDRERVAAVKRCQAEDAAAQGPCQRSLDGWSRSGEVASIRYSVSHREGIIQKQGAPTSVAADLKKPGQWLDQKFRELAQQKQAVFVLVEADGFDTYRSIKAMAQLQGLRLGWEPWYKGDPIYFWGNTGRSLTVQ